MFRAEEKEAFAAYVEEQVTDEESGILSESDAVREIVLDRCRKEGFLGEE